MTGLSSTEKMFCVFSQSHECSGFLPVAETSRTPICTMPPPPSQLQKHSAPAVASASAGAEDVNSPVVPVFLETT